MPARKIKGRHKKLMEMEIVPTEVRHGIDPQLAKRFALEYLHLGNASKAYALVHPNATPASCVANSSRYLKLPSIQRALREVQEDLGRDIKVSLETQVARLESLWYETKDLKVLQELNKMLGFYAPDKSINLNVQTKMELTEDEKRALRLAFGESRGTEASR